MVEVDISAANTARLQLLMRERGSLPEGESLRQHLSPETWRRLEAYAQEQGIPMPLLSGLQPALVITMLSSLRLAEAGLRPELGIDRHFLEQRPPGMRLLQLESAEQQIQLLLDFPEPDLLLQQTLVQLDDIDQLLQPIYDAWLAGDAAQLHRLLREDESARHPAFEPVYEQLFDARNRAMAARIETYLEGSGSYFVVVGAGHLVGPEGIIALLARSGYEARRL